VLSKKSKKSRGLVIDADIACSAGGVKAVAARSKSCREFLLAVCKHGLHYVHDSLLAEEWREHGKNSSFTRHWLREMYGSKQVTLVEPKRLDRLQEKIRNSLSKTTEIDAVDKDFHLVEIAIATDNPICSLDDNVRRPLAKASVNVAELGKIVWVNPEKAKKDALAWVKNGAPHEEKRTLSHYGRAERLG
jgi:hypothetical protein